MPLGKRGYRLSVPFARMLAIEERYRSGHNGAASKADGRKPRGFESHPLRHFFFETSAEQSMLESHVKVLNASAAKYSSIKPPKQRWDPKK